MAIAYIFTDASSVMTVVSLATFAGILWWTFGLKRSADFDAAARLPFADDPDYRDGSDGSDGSAAPDSENKHG